MMLKMLSHVICREFEVRCGKHQLTNAATKDDPKAFLVSFGTRIDYDKEEGHRYLDLLIYGPMNYVQVWVRRRADVISVDDMDYDDDGDGCPKPGKDYVRTSSAWTLLSDHDSGWRSGVERALAEKDITGLETFGGGDWWKLVPAKDVPEKE